MTGMDDLTQELEHAGQELTPQWDVERAARLYAGTRQLARRRVVRRAAVGSLAALAAGAALAFGLDVDVPVANGTQQARGADSRGIESSSMHTLRLADGSRAEMAGARSDLEVLENSESKISVRLVAGRAHFDAVHNTQRSFVVEAEPYRV